MLLTSMAGPKVYSWPDSSVARTTSRGRKRRAADKLGTGLKFSLVPRARSAIRPNTFQILSPEGRVENIVGSSQKERESQSGQI